MRQIDSSTIARAVTRIADDLRSIRRTLGELESCLEAGGSWQREEHEDHLNEVFVYKLETLGRKLPVLLDLIGMTDTRESFISSWSTFSENLGATEVRSEEWGLWLESKPLTLLTEIIDVLEVDAEEPQGIKANLETLEYVLGSLPQIITARKIVPRREADIQRVMDAHLEHTFPDYSNNLMLPKGPKRFKPDGSIKSLKVLIELKFVDSAQEVPTALSGVMEDQSGYADFSDWTRFYSVVYQTGSYVSEKRFRRPLRFRGTEATWRAIVVTGPGGRKPTPLRSEELEAAKA